MTRTTHYTSRLAAAFLGAFLLAGTTLVPDAYADPNADPDVMPREFGNCMVGPLPNSFDKVIVFCGESKTEPSIVIGTMIDTDNPKKPRIPEVTYFNPHIKDINKKLTFDFGPYHHVEGWVTRPPGAWFIDEEDLSRWPSIFQALMSTTTFSATGDSGTDTVDLTGFSQAFQYFTSEYKRIHNQPLPGWH